MVVIVASKHLAVEEALTAVARVPPQAHGLTGCRLSADLLWYRDLAAEPSKAGTLPLVPEAHLLPARVIVTGPSEVPIVPGRKPPPQELAGILVAGNSDRGKGHSQNYEDDDSQDAHMRILSPRLTSENHFSAGEADSFT
jgi:hypothetical protein